MSKSVGASDARSALTAVEYSRQQVIAEIDMPRWYWLGLAAGWIGIGVVADVGPGWLFAAATLAFGATHAAVAQNVLSGRRRSSALSVRAELVGTRVPALVIGLLVGLSRAHRRGGVVDRCRRCGPPGHDRRCHGGDRGRPRRSGADGRSAPAGAAQRRAMTCRAAVRRTHPPEHATVDRRPAWPPPTGSTSRSSATAWDFPIRHCPSSSRPWKAPATSGSSARWRTGDAGFMCA